MDTVATDILKKRDPYGFKIEWIGKEGYKI